jgi:hypothetical protein
LLAKLDIELVAVAAKLLGPECALGFEVLGSMFRDSVHGSDGCVSVWSEKGVMGRNKEKERKQELWSVSQFFMSS